MAKDRREVRRSWWRREGVLPLTLMLGVPLAIMLTVLMWAMYFETVQSTADDQIVFGDGADGEIAVVTYERTGDRNPLAFVHWLHTGSDRRAVAVSTATGEQLWDVSVDRWWPQGPTAPLAVGGGRVYVVVEGGLVILDAADGARVAGPGGIEGLGAAALEAQGAYLYDAVSDQVLALTADGDVVGIPLGSETARPVGRDVLERWEWRLAASGEYPVDMSPGVPVELPGRPEHPCAGIWGSCAVSPSGVVVEVQSPSSADGGDSFEALVVGGVRSDLGPLGLWW